MHSVILSQMHFVTFIHIQHAPRYEIGQLIAVFKRTLSHFHLCYLNTSTRIFDNIFFHVDLYDNDRVFLRRNSFLVVVFKLHNHGTASFDMYYSNQGGTTTDWKSHMAVTPLFFKFLPFLY